MKKHQAGRIKAHLAKAAQIAGADVAALKDRGSAALTGVAAEAASTKEAAQDQVRVGTAKIRMSTDKIKATVAAKAAMLTRPR